MIEELNALVQAELNILKSFEGKKLLSYDIVSVGGNAAWNAVRLHFENESIDVISMLQMISIDEDGSEDEFSMLRVEKAPSALLSIPELADGATTHVVNEPVRKIAVSNDILDYYDSDKNHLSHITYTQAILLYLDDSILCFDKEAWFSELIFIKGGQSQEQLVFDDSGSLGIDPEEDPDTTIEYRTELIAL